MNLAERVAAGDQRALARAITLVENHDAQAPALLAALYGRTGRAHVCGITGPPGAGKSTLVQRLAVALRQRGQRVAIVAVDPSSPFTGGALLGDRVRMGEALRDPGIFMRSLANRGQVGGLSAAAIDVVALVDAAGFDTILVETVGAGQSEIEIMRLAHTTVVVSVPGLGDDIQADKAGILEIADIFVVNKADRDGAGRTASDLAKMLRLAHAGEPGINHWDAATAHGHARSVVPQAHLERRFGSISAGGMSWCPPVQRTVAKDDEGIGELVDRIAEHQRFLRDSGRWQSAARSRATERVRELVAQLALRRYFDVPLAAGHIDAVLDAVAARQLDPHAAAEQLLRGSGD